VQGLQFTLDYIRDEDEEDEDEEDEDEEDEYEEDEEEDEEEKNTRPPSCASKRPRF
jgi:hypothetical protein